MSNEDNPINAIKQKIENIKAREREIAALFIEEAARRQSEVANNHKGIVRVQYYTFAWYLNQLAKQIRNEYQPVPNTPEEDAQAEEMNNQFLDDWPSVADQFPEIKEMVEEEIAERDRRRATDAS